MKIGKVIGKITLSECIPFFKGARWLIVNPLNQDQMSRFQKFEDEVHEIHKVQNEVQNDHEVHNEIHEIHKIRKINSEDSIIVFDNLGGDLGDAIGFVEGREAASPFEDPMPIDAICAALIDRIFYKPENENHH